MYETNDGAYLEKNCKTIQLILHHKNSKQNDVLEKNPLATQFDKSSKVPCKILPLISWAAF